MAQNITTSEVRLSFVNVFAPRIDNEGNEKFSVTCLLPKSDTAGLNILKSAIDAEIEEEKNGIFKGINKEFIKHPIHDGDGYTATGKEFGPECKGHWVFSATTGIDYPPQIVDKKVQPIIDRTEMYSGCYGHVAIRVKAYDNQSKGVGFYLNAIQKTKDGESLAGSFNVKEAFKVIDDSVSDPFAL